MMTAKEMFEELGYRRSTDIDVIKYSKKLDDTFCWIKVMFDLLEKEIVLDDSYDAYIRGLYNYLCFIKCN